MGKGQRPAGIKNTKVGFGEKGKENRVNGNKVDGMVMSKDEKFRRKVKLWVGYWRCNLHRFAKDLGVKLHLFQSILLFIIELYPNFMYIASRGTGKSFLIALYAILKAILYPNIQIVISSATKGQALLMQKQYIMYFINEYPLIANEISDISSSIQNPQVTFKNGATITPVTASENSRGHRCHILILEEFAIMKKTIIDAVLKKFGTVPRQPAFSYKIEYFGYPKETNREIYISSARYKSEWGWTEVQKFFKAMINKPNREDYFYGIMSSDWHLPAEFGLTDEKKLRNELEISGGDDTTWSMEMDSLWFGENENSYFKFGDFDKNRSIAKAEYPYPHELFLANKKKQPERRKKKPNEISILSIDVASSPKEDSDNTIIDFITANEIADGYKRNLKYSESINGQKITEQALRIKQLWYDFNVDYIVLDILNIGRELYGLMTMETYDNERDMTYPALIAYNDEDYVKHAYDPNGLPCIFVVKATADINNEIARSLQANLRLGKIGLLINESEFRDNAVKQDERYLNKSAEERLKIEMPYIQTTIMVNETINLEYTINNGKIRVQEVGKARKDRYTTLAYGNWFIGMLEQDILRKNDEEDWEVFVM
jgi:hypothetical protein